MSVVLRWGGLPLKKGQCHNNDNSNNHKKKKRRKNIAHTRCSGHSFVIMMVALPRTQKCND